MRITPALASLRLEENYRSTQKILDAAGEVVANNKRRLGKTLISSAHVRRKFGVF